jgi:hypothetical protein
MRDFAVSIARVILPLSQLPAEQAAVPDFVILETDVDHEA